MYDNPGPSPVALVRRGGRVYVRICSARLKPGDTKTLCALRVEHVHFIRRGAVHAWNLDVVQAQVNAKLRAVVNEVTQDHGAQDGSARHGKNLLSLISQ